MDEVNTAQRLSALEADNAVLRAAIHTLAGKIDEDRTPLNQMAQVLNVASHEVSANRDGLNKLTEIIDKLPEVLGSFRE